MIRRLAMFDITKAIDETRKHCPSLKVSMYYNRRRNLCFLFQAEVAHNAKTFGVECTASSPNEVEKVFLEACESMIKFQAKYEEG